MTGSRRTSLASGGPGRSVASGTARLSWSPSVARLGQPFMLWNHCEHRALVRDELAVRIPISEAAAGLSSSSGGLGGGRAGQDVA